MDKLLGREFPKKLGKGLRAWLDARTKDEGLVRAARRRLVECGFSEERVRLFPADQVILLDEKRELEVRFDDVMKTHRTCPSGRPRRWPARPSRPTSRRCSPMPSCRRWPTAPGARRGWTSGSPCLRHVEALRLYAAEHDGTLPAKLSDITVPLPDDPFTGKPFRYEVAGNTAHLRGTPPPGMEKDPTYNVHYDVILGK